MVKTNIIFRADGNSKIGLGHINRLLALAELLSPNFNTIFVIQESFPEIHKQIEKICKALIVLPNRNAENLLEEAWQISEILTGNEIIILDGYNFSTQYQKILKLKESDLVCLDDLQSNHFEADAIINIAGGLDPQKYKIAPFSKLYLGPAYALLRKPFREVQREKLKQGVNLNHLLICFGGADPENYTLKFLSQLSEKFPSLLIEVVTGSAYAHKESLKLYLSSGSNVLWHTDLSDVEMLEKMRRCRIAVCSASTVAYEYCAVTGLLFIVNTAENQENLFNFLLKEGLALPVDSITSVLNGNNKELIFKELSIKQRNIFNGSSEINLINLFKSLEIQANLTFRLVTEEDVDLLFEWANDPLVRQFSFNPKPIPYETHVNWLKSKIRNSGTLFLAGEISGQVAAILRFEIEDEAATINYQIGTNFRGKGLGHKVLLKGILKLREYFPEVTMVMGFVQPENVASIRTFEKAAFESDGNTNSKNNALCFFKRITSDSAAIFDGSQSL